MTDTKCRQIATDADLLRAVATGLETYYLLPLGDTRAAARRLREIAAEYETRDTCRSCGTGLHPSPYLCARCQPDRAGG